jgi:cell division protein FtsW
MAYSGAAREYNNRRDGKRRSGGKYRGGGSSGANSPPSGTKARPQTEIRIGRVDHALVLVITLLVFIGVLMIFTSGIFIAERVYGDVFHFFKKQMPFTIAGLVVMYAMANISYRHLKKFALLSYPVAAVLLILVQIVGVAYGGMTRQLSLGPIQFQPLELAKVAIMFTMAYLLSKNKDLLKNWKGFIACCIAVLFMTVLVLRGGLSSAIITAIIGFGIIFIASPHIMRFVVLGITGGVGVAGFIMFASRFRVDRIQTWLDPFHDTSEASYQIVQSLYAIGSGGLFGLGIGQSRQRSFLPLAHNDFIFAIICEELGLIGASLILFLFAILIWRGINIAIKAPDEFSSYLATGIVILMGSQAIINVAVVTNTIPNTGITMPLISYGGTSFLITMFLMGVLLNISRHSKE